jgi:hypothetical protein
VWTSKAFRTTTNRSNDNVEDNDARQRAIRKDNPAKEPPTVGKPVIIDPPDDAKPAVKDPGKKKRE